MRLRAALISIVSIAVLTLVAPAAALAAMVAGPAGGANLQASTLRGRTSLRTPIVPKGSWPVYHRDDGHTGSDPTLPAVTGVTAGWTSPTLDDEVYASPVVYGGIVYV